MAKDYSWLSQVEEEWVSDEVSSADLAGRPERTASTQAHWHETADPCAFARYMSARRSDVGWTTVVLAPRSSPAAAAEAMATHVQAALSDAGVEVISLIAPNITSPSDVAALARPLANCPGWSRTEVAREHDAAHGMVVLLGLRVSLGDGVLSEILGFGPLAMFPRTRRAPFTELVVRAAAGPWRKEPNRAHMADVPLDLESDTITELLDATHENRALELSDSEEQRAKAKVTFTLPAESWDA